MLQTSTLYNARLIADLAKKHGVKNIIISPGSRNAPLIIAMRALDFNFYSVPDERAAAFTAIGMALAEGAPTAVLCTSGSAAANYLPAVTEAFYQKVPLLLITADRPKEWIGQGAGQTIKQEGIFGSHVLYSASLVREPQDELSKNYNLRLVNEALIKAFNGPVHLNVPFDEPLYEQQDYQNEDFRFIKAVATENTLSDTDWQDLKKVYKQSKKILFLAGQMPPKHGLDPYLKKLTQRSGHLLFTETLSNLNRVPGIHTIDRLINTINQEQKDFLQPDLLITFGGEIVSKMIKAYLRDYRPKQHWHISTDEELVDTYHSLTYHLNISPKSLFKQILSEDHYGVDQWSETISSWDLNRLKKHEEYLKSTYYSDIKIYDYILKAMPEDSVFHCANSAGIRYAQLFNHPHNRKHYANRGTSGIDGSTSTAVGFAQRSDQLVSLISGDIAFLYDSAAFWNDNLPSNLKIIVINNGGGNIFRIIKGPKNAEDFERFQETKHHLNLGAIADTYHIPFQQVDDEPSLKAALQNLYSDDKFAILEILSPANESPIALKDYFQFLKD